MSLNLPICYACNTTLSRKQRTNITENVTNPPFLGAQLKKCDHMLLVWYLFSTAWPSLRPDKTDFILHKCEHNVDYEQQWCLWKGQTSLSQKIVHIALKIGFSAN